jgi:Family of unknown function (DUF695)
MHFDVRQKMAWLHRTTEIQNRSAQVLIDDRFQDSAPMRELPRLIWVGVYCRNEPGASFWHPDETAALDAVEDDLIRQCEQFGGGWAVYVMRIDTRGIREHYFYAGDAADLPAAVTALQAAHPEYRIEVDQKVDPEWDRYQTFLPQQQKSSILGRLFGKT